MLLRLFFLRYDIGVVFLNMIQSGGLIVTYYTPGRRGLVARGQGDVRYVMDWSCVTVVVFFLFFCFFLQLLAIAR